MPQIKEYSQRTSAPGPIQTPRVSGEALGAGMARELARAGAAVQDFGDTVYRAAEQREIQDASVKLSEAHASFTNELQKQLRDGTIDAEQFMQSYDEKVGELSGEYATRGGQDAFNRASSQLRSNLFMSSVHAQTEIAGVRAVESYSKMQNNLSSGIMSDPSSYQTAKVMHESYLQTQVESGFLPLKTAVELRMRGQTDLAKAALQGWIDLNPEDAKAQIKQGLWDTEFDASVKTQMLGRADEAIRGRRADEEAYQRNQKKALMEAQKVTQNTFLNKLDEGSLTSKEVLRSNLDPEDKHRYIEWIKNGPTTQTNPETFNSLFHRIHLPDGDPNKIINENVLNQYVGQGLNIESLNKLRNEVQGENTAEGKITNQMKNSLFEAAKAKLVRTNSMLGIRDPEGEENYSRFLKHYLQEYEKGKATGKSDQELLDPDSSSYIGKSISRFAKTPQQIMKSVVTATRRQNKPLDPSKSRIEGETIEQYVERMKKNRDGQ